MAVITPYAQFMFRYVSETPEYSSFSLSSLAHCHPRTNAFKRKFSHFLLAVLIMRGTVILIMSINATSPLNFWSKNVSISFARRTDVMPAVPIETKHHPSAVDLLLIKRLIAETSKPHLLQFLQHEFVNIGKAHAERLIGINHHHTLVWQHNSYAMQTTHI